MIIFQSYSIDEKYRKFKGFKTFRWRYAHFFIILQGIKYHNEEDAIQPI